MAIDRLIIYNYIQMWKYIYGQIYTEMHAHMCICVYPPKSTSYRIKKH